MFKFHMPTKVIVGQRCVLENQDALIKGQHALIVTGKSSGKKSGALDDVITVLKNHKIPYHVYDKVENNPEINDMVAGGNFARECGADFIIAIGGGSPLDAAKAIAVYAVNTSDDGFAPYDIFSGKYKNKPLPMVAIPTTAGTGSEVTPYSILTLHKEQTKRSFSCEDTFFKAAFIDGRYTKNLPLQVARNTAVDAMCHLIEGYTNKKASPSSDYMALEGLRIIGKHLGVLESGSFDVDSCTELLWASTLGGIVISQTGTTIVHSMGYELTYLKDIPHGLANGYLLYEYLKRIPSERVEDCLDALGICTLEKLKAYLEKILPRVADFSEGELIEWSKISIEAKNVASCPYPVTRELEIEIYKNSLL